MSKVKLSGKLIAIQFGRENTHIALMHKGSTPLHCVSVPTPVGAVEDGVIRDPDGLAAMLKGALRAPEFRGVKQAVFSLSSSQVITETVTTPDLPAARLGKLLQANMDVYFPVEMHNYSLLWQTIGPKPKTEPGPTELQVQLWAVPQELLAPYYPVANACGLSVAAVDYCGHSIAAAVGASFARPAKTVRKQRQKISLTTEISFRKKKDEAAEFDAAPTVRENPDTDLHLTLEPDMMVLSFVQEGQVKLQQFIRCGQRPADQFYDVSMSLEYFRSLDMGRGSNIRGLLSGSLSGDKRFVRELQDMLGIPLTRLEAAFDPAYAMCVGAAATDIDFGNAALNRMRKKPGKAATFVRTQLWQYGLIAVGGCVLAMSVMSLMSDRTIWAADINALESDRQILAIQAQQAGKYADNYNKYVSAYDSYSADWDTIFGSLHTNNDNLVLVLNELESILPEESSVLNLTISEDGIQVDFACVDKEQAAYLIMALRELEYADLAYVSNLTGGGSGAYEAPPTEGSYNLTATAEADDPLKEMISSELTKAELLDLGTYLLKDDSKLALLESCYGKSSPAKHSSFASLMQNRDKTALFNERSAALREMLNSNPFAAKLFVDAVQADWGRAGEGEVVLIWAIAPDLEKQGLLNEEILRNPAKLYENVDALLDVLTMDESNLSAAEKLICYRASGTSAQVDALNAKHQKLEAWYVYYLEVELGVQEEQQLPYLNIDALLADLLDNGYFNTGDSELDQKLNNMVSSDVHNMMAELGTPEGMAKLVDKYIANGGKTGYPEADTLITNYFTTGSTGNDLIDDQIAKTFESGNLDKTVQDLAYDYFKNGSTGLSIFDDLLSSYLSSSDCGNHYINDILDAYLDSKALDTVTINLMDQYLRNSASGNTNIDPLLRSYFDYDTRTSGNLNVDRMFLRSLESEKVTSSVNALLDKYKSSGTTTGSDVMDVLVKLFKDKGTTGNAYLTKLCRERLGVPAGAPTEDLTADMLDKYMASGKAGNDAYDALIDLYFTNGTSNDPYTDTIIDEYISADDNEETINAKFAAYIKTNSCGNPASLNTAFANYLTQKETGRDLLNTVLKGSLGSTTVAQAIDHALENYATGSEAAISTALKAQFDKFMADRTNRLTDHTEIDRVIEAYVDERITDDTLPGLLDTYLTKDTTGNKIIDELFESYLLTGKSGYRKVDFMIDNFITFTDQGRKLMSDAMIRFIASGGNSGNTVLNGLVMTYLSSLSTGNPTCGNPKLDIFFNEAYNQYNSGNQGGSDTPIIPDLPSTEDTRIKFSVQLTYKEELKQVEQEREGLNKDDKIKELEVDD